MHRGKLWVSVGKQNRFMSTRYLQAAISRQKPSFHKKLVCTFTTLKALFIKTNKYPISKMYMFPDISTNSQWLSHNSC